MARSPDMWHWASIWFFIVTVIIMIGLGIWYLITKQTGTAFWIIFSIDLIILFISFFVILFALMSRSSTKKKAQVDLNDLQGMSQFSSGGGSQL